MSVLIQKIDIFLCAFLALAFTSSSRYIKAGDCEIDGVYVLSSFVLFMSLLGINFLIRKGITCYFESNVEVHHRLVRFCELFFESKHGLMKTAFLIFLCWLPVLLILYPGTFINDTWGELQQFMAFTDGGRLHRHVLSDHHPFFDTLVMGSIIIPVAKLTGAWHVAIFLYVLLQSLFTSLAFAYSIIYIYRKLMIGRVVTVLILAFYCVMPMYAASVQTVSKDALFSWIYVFFFIFFIEVVRTNGQVLQEKSFFLKFLLFIILCILTKKVGFYVIGGSLFILLVSRLINKKRIAISFGVALFMMVAFLPVSRSILGVHSGGMQEMFSIPFQQTARYVKNHPNEISPTEKEVIGKVLIFNDLPKRYNPIFADPVKGYSQRGSKTDYFNYLRVWAVQGLRHPGTYVDAFNAMASGWFSFHEYKPLMNMGWHSQLNPKKIPEWVPERNPFSKWTATTYEKAYDMIYSNPFFMLLLSYGLYASLIPAFMMGTIFRKHRKKEIPYWIVGAPVLLTIVLGCWLSPVSIYSEGLRYLYPTLYTCPLMIAWCFFFYKNEAILSKKEREIKESV